MPGSFINLLPPNLNRPAGPGKSDPPAVAVPASAVPKFGKPAILVEDNFWSNLKQFLTERPVKVINRPGAPFVKPSFGGGMFDNLKDFFASGPTGKGPLNSRLAINWEAGFGGFGSRIKELFFPAKLPYIQVTSKPIPVKDIWTKDKNYGWTQAISMGLHALVTVLLVIPLFTNVLPTSTEASPKVDVTAIDLSPYVSKLPAGAKKAGGGGGANDRTLTPPTRGKLPKFQWTQFAAPQAKILNEHPKLAMDPSLLGPPDLKVPSPSLPNFGDPLASANSDSLGHGGGTGIGSGSGAGLGPGENGGTGGGAFRAGVNGVGTPVCFYAPAPQYSDEARKVKYQGVVVLLGTVTVDGRVVNISVEKGVGMGLDEKAIEAVRTWRCKPATGPNGRPVPTIVPVEVTFRLY